MSNQEWLDRETFLRLAAATGMDLTSPHIDELYANVQNFLASLESIRKIDVAGAEPNMAFMPPRE